MLKVAIDRVQQVVGSNKKVPALVAKCRDYLDWYLEGSVDEPLGTYAAEDFDLFSDLLKDHEVYLAAREIEDEFPGLSAVLDVAEDRLADHWSDSDESDRFYQRVDRAMEARKYRE